MCGRRMRQDGIAVASEPADGIDERRFDDLKKAWMAAAETNLAALAKAIEWAESGASDPADSLGQIHRMAHDLMGQAGQFGFDLLSHIESSLCGFISAEESKGASSQFAVIGAHQVALGYVFDQRVEGDWGPAGTAILAKLNMLAGREPTGLQEQA